ncbi:sulfotransferase family 2 domain-containing protein [Roseovarius aestuariivivens]|uniref:sulfotransferase family 2 domain-containing protein n=1 Tax=Roseovarius aestuariivivens TaxID=1888910 RepID=UPI0010811BF0|nr:sulfotransferase family 2 domain-containing protein [Roseovarius aestuariivivens]
MLVFSNDKLVFLSVPKTGTTAYEAALATRASIVVRDPPELKHAPVFRYHRFFRPALEKFVGEDFDILAVMRDPIDWLGSWYRYRRRSGMEGTRNSTYEISFDAFVQAYMQPDRPAFANVGSQAKFLEPHKNGTGVTHLFRYEDQAGLTKFLADRLGVAVETRRLNESPPGETSLSPETEARFRDMFAAEYQLYDGIRDEGRFTPLPRGAAPAHR